MASLSNADKLLCATELLEDLSSKKTVLKLQFKNEHHLNDKQLAEIVALIENLADRESGARAVLLEDGDEISLAGDSASLKPLRLNPAEGLALALLLSHSNIDNDARERIQHALLPSALYPFNDEGPQGDSSQAVREQLAEAIESGIRCQISYRSSQESEPSTRTVDPLHIDFFQGYSYLSCWKVDGASSGEERRYRIDRISEVALLEDSVEHHSAPLSLQESLANSGTKVQLSIANDELPLIQWAGIVDVEPKDESTSLVTMYVSSPEWLFDQVLASAGSIRIESPRTLAEDFIGYAQALSV